MDLSEFRKQKQELEKQISTHGKAALAVTFKKFFEKFPEVAAVRWEQYTPYFNDGDECVFGMNDFDIKLDMVGSLKEDSEYEDDGWIKSWDAKKGSVAANAINYLNEAFEDCEEIFKSTFGDGYEITATNDGFEVVEYDHD